MQKVTFPIFQFSLSTGRGSKLSLELSLLHAEHLCALLWTCPNRSLCFSCSGPQTWTQDWIFELIFPTRKHFPSADPLGKKKKNLWKIEGTSCWNCHWADDCHQIVTGSPVLVGTALPQGSSAALALIPKHPWSKRMSGSSFQMQ